MGLLDLFRKKSQQPHQMYFTGTSWLTPHNNPDTYIEGYKTLPNLYGIISLITQKSSIVPFDVMRVKNRGAEQKYKSMIKAVNSKSDYKKIMKVKSEAYEEVPNSDLERLLLKPNALQSMEELNEAFDGYLLLTGNAYMTANVPGVGRNAKRPSELIVLPSTMTTPVANNLDVEGYKVSFMKEQLEREMVGHAKYFNPLGGMHNPNESLVGLSPLVACRNLIKKYENADIAQGSMFVNKGPAGILSIEGDLTQEQADATRDQFAANNTGVHKAGKITVVSAKTHWTAVESDAVDLNIIAGKQEMLQELCNVYHLDIGIVTGESSTDNNMDNARKRTITDAVIPIVEKRKQVYNSWLAPKFGNDLVLVPDYSIFPEMEEDLGEKVKWLKDAYWLSPNQKLEAMAYEKDKNPNMDKKYFPMGLIPVDEISNDVEDLDEDLLNENGVNDS